MENENTTTSTAPETKFCAECGQKIAKKAVICPHCGCQAEPTKQEAAPQIVINNQNSNENHNTPGFFHYGNAKNKWIALLLWFFLGIVGGHKFYEGKILTGILYIFTAGFFGIGLFFDFFALIFKPTIYYV